MSVCLLRPLSVPEVIVATVDPVMQADGQLSVGRARGRRWAPLALILGGWLFWAQTVAGAEVARRSAAAAADAAALHALVSSTVGHEDPGFALRRHGEGFTAVLRGGATAELSGGGFVVETGGRRWGLDLTAMGRGRDLTPLAARPVARAEANRVQFSFPTVAAWFVNGPSGLEQGWTIPAAPAGSDPMRLDLAQHGDCLATVSADGRSLLLADPGGRELLRYTGLAAYDARGRELQAGFELRGKRVAITWRDEGAVYPVKVDPFIQVAKLTAPGVPDAFLSSIAMTEDGSTVVAGAAFATVSGKVQQGAAFVFVRPATGWATATQTAELLASNGAGGANFGWSVAISSDGSTIVVSAFFAGGYVFARPRAGWVNATEGALLTGPQYGYFGPSVAVSGDGSTVVGGAPGEGSAYLFLRPAGGWANSTPTAILTASDGAAIEFFGNSVAVSGDGAIVVVGETPSHGRPGAAYLFVRPANGWSSMTEAARLTASDGATADQFGSSLAISGDASTVVVGAPLATVGGHVAQGAAYVFAKAAGSWTSGTEAAKLTAADGGHGDALGSAVAASGDGATVVVGAAQGSTGGHGATYLFVKPGGGWASRTETAKLTAADGKASDGFGQAVAISADASSVAVAAFNGAAAYVFFLPTAACIPGETTLCIDDQRGDRRWKVSVTFTSQQASGGAHAVTLAGLGVSSGGLFWFFGPDNPEMLIKVLDGCSLNDHSWVFYAATTNVGFAVTVTDTQSGRVRTYLNPLGVAAPPEQDTAAFPCS